MDYVYLCRNGDNEELRYSVRSVIKNGNPDNVWVVGGKPDWYIGNYIEVLQDKRKFENQVNSLNNVCNNKLISDDFILMNDDFYILEKDQDYKYYDGLLIDRIKSYSAKYGNSSYARALKGAHKTLLDMGVSNPLNYDVHTPMKMNRNNLKKIVDLSLSPRSVYGNIFIHDGLEIKDVKIYKDSKNINMNSFLISTEDNSFNLIKYTLEKMFPEKSIYEK